MRGLLHVCLPFRTQYLHYTVSPATYTTFYSAIISHNLMK